MVCHASGLSRQISLYAYCYPRYSSSSFDEKLCKLTLQINFYTYICSTANFLYSFHPAKNVVWSKLSEEVVLVDLGLADVVDSKPDFTGTVPYMSPEKMQLTEYASSPGVDIWGAVTTFLSLLGPELWTRHRPKLTQDLQIILKVCSKLW